MTADEARRLGYSLMEASPFEVGLLKNGRGLRTWWAQTFDCIMPTLDHPIVLEAIELNEKNEAEFGTI